MESGQDDSDNSDGRDALCNVRSGIAQAEEVDHPGSAYAVAKNVPRQPSLLERLASKRSD